MHCSVPFLTLLYYVALAKIYKYYKIRKRTLNSVMTIVFENAYKTNRPLVARKRSQDQKPWS